MDETDEVFRGIDEWKEWCAVHPQFFDLSRIERTVADCQQYGILSLFLGFAPGKDISLTNNNYRESLHAFGMNPRQRAVLDIIHEEYGNRNPRIHLHEAVTRFALAIKGRFPFVLASEYFPDPFSRSLNYPVLHVDICDSRLPDDSFDLIVSQEVLEHVPSMDTAFIDMARILKPGGMLLATVPFRLNSKESLRKASLKQDGSIDYLLEPEYHGNPVDNKGGSLVFEIPGWDILDRLSEAGFSTSTLRMVGSARRGIIGANMLGIMVLVAQK